MAPSTGTLNPAVIPRFVLPTVQVDPSVFPMSISDTCPTCVIAQGTYDQLFVPPPVGPDLIPAVLVVQLVGNPTPQTLELNTLGSNAQVFPLPPGWGPIQSAYITGFDQSHSVTTQIFVQQ